MSNKVIALLVADLHLCHRPPAARAEIGDGWYAAMDRPLSQLRHLTRKHRCPVIIAGDLFDRPDNPAELVNWVMQHLPDGSIYAVPGQHDLMHHNYSDWVKTSFGTLVFAGKINLLRPNDPEEVGQLTLHGFPWGHNVKPLENPHSLAINVAVVHQYLWSRKQGTCYDQADESREFVQQACYLDGYDVAVYGDNHIPFEAFVSDSPLTYNCGCFIRRRITEKDHRPSVGLLYDNKKVERHYLDCSEDKFFDQEPEEVRLTDVIDISDLTKKLQELADKKLDFVWTVKQYLDSNNRISEAVYKNIMEIISKKKDPK